MTAQTLNQQRAIAMHLAQRRKSLQERRKARLDAIRERITRRAVFDAVGFVVAAIAFGVALGVVLTRFA